MLGPSALARTQGDLLQGAAHRALQSGCDWARSRLSGNPSWCADQATPQTFNLPGLKVTEGQGQVLGWVRDGEQWSRFRIRFNYQDGGPESLPNSDAMANPSSPWSDFPYVSCNNALGSTNRVLPVAGDAAQYVNAQPWPTAQLTIPQACILLSIEGAAGKTDANAPEQFYGTVHKLTAQTLLKFGGNQPVTDAAISSSGTLDIDLFGGTLAIDSLGGEAARLRSKNSLKVGDVTSTRGELRAAAGVQNGTLTNVTTTTDAASDGFYQIPLDKVRIPTSGITLQAGTYVVTSTGKLMYHPQNYAQFAAATTPQVISR